MKEFHWAQERLHYTTLNKAHKHFLLLDEEKLYTKNKQDKKWNYKKIQIYNIEKKDKRLAKHRKYKKKYTTIN